MKHFVATFTELVIKGKLRVLLNDKPLVIFAFKDKVYALADKCPHKGAPLSLGKYEEGVIQCKEHGLQIDVTTGRVVSNLKAKFLVPREDQQAVKVFKTVVEDGRVYIEL